MVSPNLNLGVALVTAETPYVVGHSVACRWFISTYCTQTTFNIWRINAFLPQEPPGQFLPMIIPFQSTTLALPLWTMVLVITQQFFTGMLQKNHSVVERCTKTALSDRISRDFAHCYFPKQPLLSNHFCTLFVHLQMLTDVTDSFYVHGS